MNGKLAFALHVLALHVSYQKYVFLTNEAIPNI